MKRGLKRGVFPLIVFLCFYHATTTCCTAADLASARFTLSVEGTLRTDVSGDVLSVRFIDSTDTTEITVNNWGYKDGKLGFKYTEGMLFKPGTKVGLYLGTTKMTEGIITSLNPTFSEGGPPTLTLVVTGKFPLKGRQLQARATKPQKVKMFYGGDLREISVVQKMGNPVIECTGKANENADIRIGVLLTITGLGQNFSGDYSVTETIHRFDQSKGNRTEFTAVKK